MLALADRMIRAVYWLGTFADGFGAMHCKTAQARRPAAPDENSGIGTDLPS